MNCKALTIAAAIVLLTGIGASQALAKTTNAAKPAAQAATTAATPAAGAGSSSAATPGTNATTGTGAGTGSGSANANASGTAGATPAAPAAAPKVTPPKAPNGPNPYGIGRLWNTGGFITRGIIVILGLMSAGTWYIFFVKMWQQSRMLSQAKQVEKKFWSSNNLNDGIENLAKNSVFRSVAEGGVRASQSSNTGLVNLNDWIAMSLNRQLEEINSRLQGGRMQGNCSKSQPISPDCRAICGELFHLSSHLHTQVATGRPVGLAPRITRMRQIIIGVVRPVTAYYRRHKPRDCLIIGAIKPVTACHKQQIDGIGLERLAFNFARGSQ